MLETKCVADKISLLVTIHVLVYYDVGERYKSLRISLKMKTLLLNLAPDWENKILILLVRLDQCLTRTNQEPSSVVKQAYVYSEVVSIRRPDYFYDFGSIS